MTSAAMMLAVCTLLFLACRSNAESDTIFCATNTDGGLMANTDCKVICNGTSTTDGSKAPNGTKCILSYESEISNAVSQGQASDEGKTSSKTLTYGKCLGDTCESDNDTSKGSSETSGSPKSPISDGASTTTGPKVTSEKNDSTSVTESANSTTTSTSRRAGTNASTVVTPETVAPAANVTIKPAGNASGPSRLAASSDVLCVAVAIGALLWRAT